MTAADLSWPGYDQGRAIAAAWHLERAAQCLVAASRHSAARGRLQAAAREHVRTARGYLGAVGFEHCSGLWR